MNTGRQKSKLTLTVTFDVTEISGVRVLQILQALHRVFPVVRAYLYTGTSNRKELTNYIYDDPY